METIDKAVNETVATKADIKDMATKTDISNLETRMMRMMLLQTLVLVGMLITMIVKLT